MIDAASLLIWVTSPSLSPPKSAWKFEAMLKLPHTNGTLFNLAGQLLFKRVWYISYLKVVRRIS